MVIVWHSADYTTSDRSKCWNCT